MQSLELPAQKELKGPHGLGRIAEVIEKASQAHRNVHFFVQP